jgi:hypothetical protein
MVEKKAAQHKVNQLQARLQDVSKASLVSKIVSLIERDAPVNELYFVRDELLLSLEGQKSVQLLIPKQGQEGKIFYKITPWDYNKDDQTPISQSLNNLFRPKEEEQKRFRTLLREQESFASVGRHHIRVFQPVTKAGQIQLILLLDTGRSVDSAYLMSRRKWD